MSVSERNECVGENNLAGYVLEENGAHAVEADIKKDIVRSVCHIGDSTDRHERLAYKRFYVGVSLADGTHLENIH